MQIVKLIQGTPEWHAHRAKHFNASDAPAMMGFSSYKTRGQLLQQLKTGITPEVDAATQRRFDEGHKYEALARPLAEKAIGDELFPCVGVDGKYSASFDGITVDGAAIFEHKTLNNRLRFLTDNHTGADLPEEYRVQMEHQLMVSGATGALFMATSWNGENLVDSRLVMYRPDPTLRERIIAGWAQFEEDLATYQAPEPKVEAVGRTPETLPALRIELSGAVTASNLMEFKSHAIAVFKGINRDLQTDQDFADAEKAVKWCSEVETRLDAAKQHALSQTASIDELFTAIDDMIAEARVTRLELDKMVKARKEAIKAEIVRDGVVALSEHVKGLNTRIGRALMPATSLEAGFANAIKGKRTIETMRSAVSDALAKAKIEANATADAITINLRLILAQDVQALFPDVHTLVLKAADDLQAVIDSRIAKHKASEAARIEADLAKAEASKISLASLQQINSVTSTAMLSGEFSSGIGVAPYMADGSRPSREQIVSVLSVHFKSPHETVLEWLQEIHFGQLEEV